jgi:hypothetical protein
MKLLWKRDLGHLVWDDQILVCPCNVRTLANGRRRRLEKVVRSENADGTPGVPYDPKPCPLGTWAVLALLPKTDPYEAPYFISSDAWQPVDEWTEEEGHYGEPTGRVVNDYGYGLHCSTSTTTLGCGRISDRGEAEELFSAIRSALDARGKITLEVV